jgi:hypothetical protein
VDFDALQQISGERGLAVVHQWVEWTCASKLIGGAASFRFFPD